MEGDNVWVGGDEVVIVYFVCGMTEPVIDVVGGWNARRVWIGDVDDFHGTMDAAVNQER